MRRPEYVTTESIVTAAQWTALAEYMRWAYVSLPQTVVITATSGTTAYNATSSFTTGTVIYNRSSGSANVAYVPVLGCTTGVSSGFTNYGQGGSQTQANNVPIPFVSTSTSVPLPTSTAYFSGQYQCACTVAIEGGWMEDA